eukprot:scaffold81806_cov56-Phaeocystis_antarctica.AAC.2
MPRYDAVVAGNLMPFLAGEELLQDSNRKEAPDAHLCADPRRQSKADQASDENGHQHESVQPCRPSLDRGSGTEEGFM